MVNVTAWSGNSIWNSPVALICPTRGRPGNADRLIRAWAATAVCSDLIFCVDTDDPAGPGYTQLAMAEHRHRGIVTWLAGPRQGLCGWTDLVARDYAGQYEAFLSVGDDHVPETPGFDRILLDATAGTGGGFAYGDDGVIHQPSDDWPEPHNLPTACLITANVIQALGGMCLPGAEHMFTDPYWLLLSNLAGCRHFLPQVKITHHHPAAGRAAWDLTYAEGARSWPGDERAYNTWRLTRWPDDAKTVWAALQR
jgi:hypothetical protein